MISQISLKIWKEDYNSEYCLFNGDFNSFVNILLIEKSPIFLTGPKKSGKKHLLYKLSFLRNFNVFFLNEMSDSEIIYYYDKTKISSEFCVFVRHNFFNFSSKDVESRMNSLFKIEVKELTKEDFLTFLNFRLKKIGVTLDSYLLNYSILRLDNTYEAVDSFVSFLKTLKLISIKTLQFFFKC